MANTLALEQITDVVETENGELHDRCRAFPDPQIPNRIDAVKCAPPFLEADPLARPFVHSYAASLAAAGLVNLAVRELGRDRAARYALAGVVTLYPLLLVHNAHVLHVEASFRL